MKKIEFGNTFIIGDSYSSYAGTIPKEYNHFYIALGSDEDTPDNAYRNIGGPENMWWSKVLAAGNGNLLLNCSKSGTTVCATTFNNYIDYKDCFVTRTKNYVTGSEINGEPINTVFIFGGTNDSWAKSPIGEITYSDFSDENIKNFAPAYAALINHFKVKVPKAQIISLVNKDKNEEEYVNAMHEICAHYNVPCIDVFGLEMENGHPTANGMQKIAEEVLDFLSK